MADMDQESAVKERVALVNGTVSPPSPSRIQLHEAHFLSLRKPSNIYGLLHLCMDGSNKLVVATLRGEVHCLEFHDPMKQRPPSFKSITFSYIPVGVEVVSIDAIMKEPHGVIIGITLIKTDTEPNEAYFNLYGIHGDAYSTFQWEDIADDWQPLNLKYTPFQIANTKILAGDHWEPVFLVSGDDLKVHLYRGYLPTEINQFIFQEEESLEGIFPEFQALPSSVTYMDTHLIGMHRLTALGCQTGHVQCTLVDLTSNALMKKENSSMVDGPITSVKLFNSKANQAGEKDEMSSYHLLVCSAIELGIVFLNVLQNGFSRPVILPHSYSHDSVLCSVVADVDWDGRNELLLGTYGKRVLAYKLDEETASAGLVWERSFPHPVQGVWYGDITGDGLGELVVLSSGGVHVLQHDLNQASELCIKRAMDILNITDNR